MKKIMMAATVACGAALGLTGCAQLSQGVTAVCADVASLPPAAIAMLDAQPPNSAIGVVWADTKSGCANGVPVAGVDTSWTGMVWGMVKTLAPTVLPMILGLL